MSAVSLSQVTQQVGTQFFALSLSLKQPGSDGLGPLDRGGLVPLVKFGGTLALFGHADTASIAGQDPYWHALAYRAVR